MEPVRLFNSKKSNVCNRVANIHSILYNKQVVKLEKVITRPSRIPRMMLHLLGFFYFFKIRKNKIIFLSRIVYTK